MISSVRYWGVGSLLALLLLATTLMAAEGRGRPAKIGPVVPNAESVEMFAAIEKGDIEVKLIQKDSTECRVTIKNNTKKPLNVKLPEAFAGVPVLAQGAMGAPGGGARKSGGGSRSSGGGSQGTGGGMTGGGGGMFGLPPGQDGKLTGPAGWPDHRKRGARPHVPYQIKPLESYTTKPGVRELCQMVGAGEISQRAAQAAAWHLNNDMTWEELGNKKIHRLNGPSQPYFSQAEIQAGMQIANTAVHAAKEQKKAAPETKEGPQSMTGDTK
jgi:hypothetical protein